MPRICPVQSNLPGLANLRFVLEKYFPVMRAAQLTPRPFFSEIKPCVIDPAASSLLRRIAHLKSDRWRDKNFNIEIVFSKIPFARAAKMPAFGRHFQLHAALILVFIIVYNLRQKSAISLIGSDAQQRTPAHCRRGRETSKCIPESASARKRRNIRDRGLFRGRRIRRVHPLPAGKKQRRISAILAEQRHRLTG